MGVQKPTVPGGTKTSPCMHALYRLVLHFWRLYYFRNPEMWLLPTPSSEPFTSNGVSSVASAGQSTSDGADNFRLGQHASAARYCKQASTAASRLAAGAVDLGVFFLSCRALRTS